MILPIYIFESAGIYLNQLVFETMHLMNDPLLNYIKKRHRVHLIIRFLCQYFL